MEIYVDLSCSKNIEGINLSDKYYIDCILNVIDSIKEGQTCMRCGGECDDTFKSSFIINLLTDKATFKTNKIYESVRKYFSNLNKKFSYKNGITDIILKEMKYENIYKIIEENKHIVLGGNIHSYFAAFENKNDVEDVIIIGFQYGLLKNINNSINFDELISRKKIQIYTDKESKPPKFYIDNPLMRSEFIKISDLNYILNS